MLEVEEGLLRIKQLLVQGEEVLHAADAGLLLAFALVGGPVRADEGVAVDVPAHHRRVFLVEYLLPVRLLVGAQDVLGAFRIVGPYLLRVAAVVEALEVVVAVHEEPLNVAAVGCLVVREHLEPGVRHELQLVDESLVGDVAHYHHGVDALGAEPLEGVDQRGGVVAVRESFAVRPQPHVDIAHDTERDVGIAARERAGMGLEDTVSAERAEGRETAYEPSA